VPNPDKPVVAKRKSRHTGELNIEEWDTSRRNTPTGWELTPPSIRIPILLSRATYLGAYGPKSRPDLFKKINIEKCQQPIFIAETMLLL